MRKIVTRVVPAIVVLAAATSTIALIASSISAAPANSTAEPLKTDSARVVIAVDSVIAPGSEFVASIILPDTTDSLGGFSLLLEYDFDAVVVDSAVPGSLIAGEWEYFTYRTDVLPDDDSGFRKAYLRLVAIANQNDPEKKMPSARSRIGAGELARIYLYSSDRRGYLNNTTMLRFRWNDCTSNSFSDASGNDSYLSRRVYDAKGQLLKNGVDRYSGAASGCFQAIMNKAIPYFDYYDAEFVIRPQVYSPADSLQPHGE